MKTRNVRKEDFRRFVRQTLRKRGDDRGTRVLRCRFPFLLFLLSRCHSASVETKDCYGNLHCLDSRRTRVTRRRRSCRSISLTRLACRYSVRARRGCFCPVRPGGRVRPPILLGRRSHHRVARLLPTCRNQAARGRSGMCRHGQHDPPNSESNNETTPRECRKILCVSAAKSGEEIFSSRLLYSNP